MPNNPTGLFNNEYPYTDFHELNLSWVILKVKELLDKMKNMEDWRADYQKTVDDLQKLYDDLIAGRYPPTFVANLRKWIEEHGIDIIGELVKMVFFGITDDGYFVAYIPESWDDITFGTTGLDDFPAGFDYGHLTLSYEIGG